METVEYDAFLGGKKLVTRQELVFRPAASALILKDGKALPMTNWRTGNYVLPGGGSELGEQLESVLKREVKEETGIEIRIDLFLFWKENFFYFDPTGHPFHSFQFFYSCSPLTQDIVADEWVDDSESGKPRWIEIAKLCPQEIQWCGEEIVPQLNRLVPL